MLILGVKKGEEVIFVDEEKNKKIGKLIRLKPRRSDPTEILLGFDFDAAIRILRGSLVGGKDAESEQKHT